MKTIIVTGIGGVVGQGIVRNARAMGRDLRIIGVNISAVSAGNHLCDDVFLVPYAYEEGYITAMKEIVLRTSAQLIIPSTDYESYYLAKFEHEFPIPIAASPAEVTFFCLDKYRNWEAFSSRNIPFASSVLPSQFHHQFEHYIVKPREGRGSRGIHIQPSNVADFDDTNLVQELLSGPEITSTFYVLKDGSLLGSITMQRELESGNTAKAEVVKEYDDEVNKLASKLITAYPFRGSVNIQSKVTSAGIVPFEINCRISGTNSIRSQFGFNDVAYTIQEHVFHEKPQKPAVTQGCAMRVMVDVVYPNMKLSDVRNNLDNFYTYE
jgi:carbamoyl-phosphate synthase large subunit